MPLFVKNVLRTSLLSLIVLLTACSSLQNAHMDFHYDADLARLEHLEYWTGIIEEYEKNVGYFPFHNELENEESIGLVRIATPDQSKYFDPESNKYAEELDNNASARFQEFSVSAFVKELERGLGREIYEKYDIQYAPDGSPIWYNYFVTNDGYLLWITCITCDVTLISTLLYDGYTPTVNIVSEGMKGKVSKALTRGEMLTHPIFVQWKERKYFKEGFVREREELHSGDSKQDNP